MAELSTDIRETIRERYTKLARHSPEARHGTAIVADKGFAGDDSVSGRTSSSVQFINRLSSINDE